MSDAAPRCAAVADALVTVINDLEIEGLIAVRNSAPYHSLEELKRLQCDVFPTQIRRPREIRKGCAKVISIDVVLQQQVRDQTRHDELTNMADDILFAVLHESTTGGGPRRLLSGTVLIQDGSLSADEIFDGQAKYEDHRFDCRIRFTMIWRP